MIGYLGLGGGSGTLNLNDNELALLVDGFSGITIGATSIELLSEDFSDGVMPTSFEQTLSGSTAFSGGNAAFQGDGRHYLRTVQSDFTSSSFVAEVTVTMSGSADGITFFGIGPATSDARTQPVILMELQPDSVSGRNIIASDNGPNTDSIENGAGSGTHRLQIVWDAQTQTATLGIHRNYTNGPFVATHTLLPVAGGTNGFTTANSHIFFGGDANAIFDDFIIRQTITAGVDVESATFSDPVTILGSSISVAGLDAGTNAVTLKAHGGAIVDGDTNGTDVIAGSVAFQAVSGVGTASNPLETSVAGIEADAGSGGLHVSNVGTLTVGGVSSELSGLSVSGGSIVVTNSGTLAVAEDVSNPAGGDVTLTAGETIIPGTGELTFVEMQKHLQAGVDGLDGAARLSTSPDGRHIYVAARASNAVAVFGRDTQTGELAFVESHVDGAAGVDGLGGAYSTAVTPDGSHVYVASSTDNAVAVFSRNSVTGTLTFIEQLVDGTAGVDGIAGAQDVAVSADGDHVYVVGFDDDAIAVFSRNETTGSLTFVEAEKDGVGPVSFMNGASSVTLSSDGSYVYVTAVIDRAIEVFSRNPTTGELTLSSSERTSDGAGGFVTVFDLALSPDNAHLYSISFGSDSVGAYSRNATTGVLTFLEFETDAVDGVEGLDHPQGVDVSPDGRHVYVVSANDETIALFNRNSGTGELSFVEVLTDGVDGVDGLRGAVDVFVSADGRHVYATGAADDSVAVFARNADTSGMGPDDLTINANVTASGGNGSLTLRAANDVSHVSGTVAVVGSGVIEIDASESTADGAITMSSGAAVNSESGSITFESQGPASLDDVSSTSGGISVTAGDIVLSDTVSSGGQLTLAPAATDSTIGVGGGAGDFNVSDLDLTRLAAGFSSIIIGDQAAGTGSVDIQSSVFSDNVRIVGGSISVTGLNAGSNDVALTARTGNIVDGGNELVALYDLADDWSDSVNPNGTWTYREGINALPTNVADWQGTLTPGEWTTPQRGWADSENGNDRVPFFFQSNGTEIFTHDWQQGDVVVHTTDGDSGVGNGTANIIWTSPLDGVVDITGGTWLGKDVNGRSNDWKLYVDDVLVSQGSLTSTDAFSRAAPFNFAAGSGGAAAVTDIVVSTGDVIMLELVRTHPQFGEFTGVELTINQKLDILAGSVALRSVTGIGDAGAIDASVSSLAAEAATAGGVDVINAGDVQIATVDGLSGLTTNNGPVSVTVTGELTSVQPIATSGGDVILSATGAIALSGASADITTGGGTVVIHADGDANGVGQFASDSGAVINTSDGDVRISAANLSLNGSIDAGTATVIVAPTSGRAITLGAGGSDFGFSDAEADRVTAAKTQVGYTVVTDGVAASGAVSVDGNLSPANSALLRIRTGGAVTSTDSTNLISGERLNIEAGGAVGTVAIPLRTDVDSLVVTTASANGDQHLVENGATNEGLFDAGTGAVNFEGGTFVISATSAAGEVNVNAGTLLFSAAEKLGAAIPVLVASGATLNLNNNSQTVGSIAGAGSISLGTATLTTGGDNSSTVISGAVTATSGRVSKTGNGTLTLSGSDPNTARVDANVGTVVLAKDAGVDAVGSLNVADSAVVRLAASNQIPDDVTIGIARNGLLDLDGFDEGIRGVVLTGAITTGAGTLTLEADGSGLGAIAYNSSGPGATLSGNLDLGGATRTFYVADNTPGTEVTISAAIANGGINKTVNGVLRFSGTASNTYTGLTTVTGGTLKLNKSGGAVAVAGNLSVSGTLFLDQGDQIADTSLVTVNDGGHFNLNDRSDRIGRLAGAANSTVSIGTATLTTGDASDRTFAGDIIGAGSLVKEGSGTFTLSGTNSFTGATAVNDGVLVVDGTLPGNVSVGATGILSGSGTVGDVTAGGTLAPGSSPGILSTGNVILTSGGTLAIEVNGSTVGTGYDQLAVTGTVDLGGATLNLSGSGSVTSGQSVTIVNNDDADAITGTFNELTEGASVLVSGREFTISYVGGDGNDVTLTANDALTVTTTADVVDANDGELSLREAVIAANAAGDQTITLPAGTYTLTIAGTGEENALTGDLDVKTGAGITTIVGAGSGTTTIDGNDIDRIFHVHESAELRLADVTVTNGKLNDAGGAITLFRSNLQVTDSVFSHHEADGQGGAIHGFESVVQITDSLFTGNKADADGGGGTFDRGGAISSRDGGTLIVRGSTFTSNSAVAGGAINWEGTLDVAGSTFTQNTEAGQGGGAIYASADSVIAGSLIDNNTGVGVLFFGSGTTAVITDSTISNSSKGGIVSNPSLRVERTTIDGNTTTGSGGGIDMQGGGLTLIDSTVSNNTVTTASFHGGGIDLDASNATIINSTISGNSVPNGGTSKGGGIYTSSGDVTVIHSTITDNSARQGGGLALSDSGAGSFTLTGTIVAGNTASSSDNDVRGTFVSQGDNLIGDVGTVTTFTSSDLTGTTGSALDAKLGALADNGGSTETHLPLAGSPAIDAAVVHQQAARDQRGAPRNVDSDGDGVARTEIGSVEALDGFLVDSFADAVDANIGDGVAVDSMGRRTLRAAIQETNAGAIDVIYLAAGTYILDIQGNNENVAASGDLDIGTDDDLTVVGAGIDATVVDASGLGGRVFHQLGVNRSLTLLDLELTGSSHASGNGGAVFVTGTLSLQRVAITDSSAVNGGAIATSGNDPGHLLITDSVFTGNSANSGGAIELPASSDATILNSVFDSNQAGVSGSGGAIHLSGMADVRGTSFISNSAQDGGAIRARGGSLLTVTQSTLFDNTATTGGAIFTQEDTTLTNVTISGNMATTGGGVYVAPGVLSVISSTIANNTATSRGGGIGVFSSVVDLRNVILAANTSPTGPDGDGTFASSVNSIIGDGTDSNLTAVAVAGLVGTSGAPVDAMLSPLADNGGMTLTHALQAGSPAIDSGTTVSVPSVDQRGVLRDAMPDAGSFEAGSTAIIVSTTLDTPDADTGNGVAADAFGEISLRAAIQHANTLGSAVTIAVPAGNYVLSLPGVDEDAAATGDLDIAKNITLVGAGAGQTVIDAGGLDRVFDVAAAGQLSVVGITLTGGLAETAGGVLRNAGTVTLTDTEVQTELSLSTLPAITNTKTLTISSGTSLTLSPFGAFTPVDADSFVVLENSDTVNGTFSGLPEGGTIESFLGSGRTAVATYAGGSGDDLELITGVPVVEFSTAAFAVQEGNVTSISNVVTLSRSGNTSVASTVDVIVSAGTATVGVDFAAGPVTVAFAAGETSKGVPIQILGEQLVELNETINLSLSNFTSGGVVGAGAPTATLTVTNDDVARVSVNDVSVAEGNSGQTSLTFTVSIDQTASSDITVVANTANATATAGVDYIAVTNRTVTISTGQTSVTTTILLTGETLVEGDETFALNLTDAKFGGATDATRVIILDASGIGTITNDDAARVSVNDVSVAEGNSAQTSLTFTVSIDQAASSDVTVVVNTANATATAGVDYTAVTDRTVTISAGQTSTTTTVLLTGETLVEGDETFALNLTDAKFGGAIDATRVTILDASGIGTITNDDAARVSVNDVSMAEGNSGQTSLTFTVSIDQAASSDITVVVNTANATATAGVDYTAVTDRTVTISAGQTSTTTTVLLTGETLVETDETFALNLTDAKFGGAADATRVTILDASGTGTITNDDVARVSVNDVSVAEGNSGQTSLTFTVSIDQAASSDITVVANTANATAIAGVDYIAVTNRTVTISAGQTSTTTTVLLTGETLVETDETFALNLTDAKFGGATDATRVTILDGSGTGTITNDDVARVSVNDVSVAEGNSGQTSLTFTVSIDQAASSDITVVANTANATAIAGVDYIAVTNRTVTISAGQTSTTTTVLLTGETLVETDETFALNLTDAKFGGATDASRVTSLDASGSGTITNDDVAQFLIVESDGSTLVSEAGGMDTMTVSLADAPQSDVVIRVTSGDTTEVAVVPTVLTFTTQNFAIPQTVTVVGVDDLGVVDGDQTVALTFSVDDGASDDLFDDLADQVVTATATDVGPLNGVSISDATLVEGDTNERRRAELTVSLDEPAQQPITVTLQGIAMTASANDFEPLNRSISFAAGEQSRTIAAIVIGDALLEDDEFFEVQIVNSTNSVITDGIGRVTIVDDDDPVPVVSIGDVTLVEGRAPEQALAVFTVERIGGSNIATTVQFSTAGGTADAGVDFVSTGGIVEFLPGQLVRSISVPVIGDSFIESNEFFTVGLSNVTGGTIGDGTGLGTILNDDTELPQLSISGVEISEGVIGQITQAFVTVTRSGPIDTAVSAELSTSSLNAPGQATAGIDYASLSRTVNFLPQELTKRIPVIVFGDSDAEIDERLFVTLSNSQNATITAGAETATVTILNDDLPTPLANISDVSKAEGIDGQVTSFIFDVRLTGPASQTVLIDFVALGESASAPEDFQVAAGTLTFEPGETLQSISIPVHGDGVEEADEQFVVTLSNPIGAVIDDDQGIGTIENDDEPLPLLSILAAEGFEGTGTGRNRLGFDVVLSSPSDQLVTVVIETQDDTAISQRDGRDFFRTTTVVAFDPGETVRRFEVEVVTDAVVEPDEQFFVQLRDANNAEVDVSLARGLIRTDDFLVPVASIEPIELLEGGPEATTATLAVTLSSASDSPVAIEFATANGTAEATDDYQPVSGTLNFAVGETRKEIVIPVVGNLDDEADRFFFVNLTNPTGAELTVSQAMVTILDDDTPAPTFSISSVELREGTSSSPVAELSVVMLGNPTVPVTVGYTTRGGTAVAGEDYVSSAGTLTFNPGDREKTIQVQVNADADFESDEEYFVELTSTSFGDIVQPQATVTLINDDGVVLTDDGDSVTQLLTDRKAQLLSEPGGVQRLLDELSQAAAEFCEALELEGPHICLAFDPVDPIVTDPQGRNVGFKESTGVVNQIPNSYYSGDGDVEVLAIPQAERGIYNLSLEGVGNGDFLAVGRLVDGSGGSQSVELEGNISTGTLEVALDFTRQLPAREIETGDISQLASLLAQNGGGIEDVDASAASDGFQGLASVAPEMFVDAESPFFNANEFRIRLKRFWDQLRESAVASVAGTSNAMLTLLTGQSRLIDDWNDDPDAADDTETLLGEFMRIAVGGGLFGLPTGLLDAAEWLAPLSGSSDDQSESDGTEPPADNSDDPAGNAADGDSKTSQRVENRSSRQVAMLQKAIEFLKARPKDTDEGRTNEVSTKPSDPAIGTGVLTPRQVANPDTDDARRRRSLGE